jgi:hypothetical protein
MQAFCSKLGSINMRKYLAARRSHTAAVLTLGLLLSAFAVAQPAIADGWHNPVLYVGSIDDWLGDLKAELPDLGQQIGSTSLRAGRNIEDLKKLARNNSTKKQSNGNNANRKGPARSGNLQANLTTKQQALLGRKANDCLQVLAFMKQGNIIPREFPKFPINKMAEYRLAAKKLLLLMGSSGKQAVLGALQKHLMNGFTSAGDVSFHPDYVADLLKVLGDAASRGLLTPEELDSLSQAMQGSKPPVIQRLVKAIDRTLSETLTIQTLLDWSAATKDKKRRNLILAQLRKRLSTASPSELQQALSSGKIDAKTKAAMAREIRRVLPELGIAGLLNLLLV